MLKQATRYTAPTPDDRAAEAERLAALDDNDLIREIAAMLDDREGLEREAADAERTALAARRECDEAIARLADADLRILAARDELRGRG